MRKLRKYLTIYEEAIRHIQYDFATPFWISLYIRKILFYFFLCSFLNVIKNQKVIFFWKARKKPRGSRMIMKKGPGGRGTFNSCNSPVLQNVFYLFCLSDHAQCTLAQCTCISSNNRYWTCTYFPILSFPVLFYNASLQDRSLRFDTRQHPPSSFSCEGKFD